MLAAPVPQPALVAERLDHPVVAAGALHGDPVLAPCPQPEQEQRDAQDASDHV
jgi:hypothetical protein